MRGIEEYFAVYGVKLKQRSDFYTPSGTNERGEPIVMQWNDLSKQTHEAAIQLFESARPEPGELMVVGCSTSEVMGQRIGSASSEDAARAIMDGLLNAIKDAGLYLAVQGCEHINRALCVERECLARYRLREVRVKPWLHAGGALVSEAEARFNTSVMVENLCAEAALGMDIGGTLIGMHLRPVAVPVRSDIRQLGQAALVLARTRPPYIGGPRARYGEDGETHAQ